MLSRDVKKIYLIGIKGTGMSSLAVLLKKMGYRVTGSDTAEKFFTESQLVKNKIPYFQGFDAKNLEKAKPNLVITSTAYKQGHEEIVTAKHLKLTTVSYPQAIGEISKTLRSVAVCGSHGKTTTTSMLGWLMQTNSQTMTLTGTVADQLNTKLKKLKYFVFEADEYQNKLQYYSPANIILTSVDYDHPDFFKTRRQYHDSFSRFANKTIKSHGTVLYNADDTISCKLLAGKKGTMSYGFHTSADYRVIKLNKELDSFTIIHQNKTWLNASLSVYGRHNILNAAAAAIMASRLGIKRETIKKSLRTFVGVKRRLEAITNKYYIALDDYGHHPTEVKAALVAVRNKYPRQNIIAVFHPHTLSRTKSLLKEFGQSFKDADLAIILDIVIPSRETDLTIKIHSKDLVKEINKNGTKAIYLATIPEAAKYITQHVPKDTIVITIGAGDVWKLHSLIK